MQIQCEDNGNSKAVDLDQIIDIIMENAEAANGPSQFDYIKYHDQAIMAELKKYSQSLGGAGVSGLTWQELEDMVGSMSEDLLASISAANLAYLKHGMKLGARLLIEFLH